MTPVLCYPTHWVVCSCSCGCLLCVQAFCLRNSSNQDVLFPHLSLFTEQLSLNVGAEDTITALVLENRRLCNNVPDDVLWELAAQVGGLDGEGRGSEGVVVPSPWVRHLCVHCVGGCSHGRACPPPSPCCVPD